MGSEEFYEKIKFAGRLVLAWLLRTFVTMLTNVLMITNYMMITNVTWLLIISSVVMITNVVMMLAIVMPIWPKVKHGTKVANIAGIMPITFLNGIMVTNNH